MSALRPGIAKIIEKILASKNFEYHETDHHIAVNASCIVYTDTGSLKQVH